MCRWVWAWEVNVGWWFVSEPWPLQEPSGGVCRRYAMHRVVIVCCNVLWHDVIESRGCMLTWWSGDVCVERINKTLTIEKKNMEMEERGIKLRLTIVDTPGFNDSINCEDWWDVATVYTCLPLVLCMHAVDSDVWWCVAGRLWKIISISSLTSTSATKTVWIARTLRTIVFIAVSTLSRPTAMGKCTCTEYNFVLMLAKVVAADILKLR